MVIHTISLEGANDEAIEDAASRIHEASRLRPRNVDTNLRNNIGDEKRSMVFSVSSDTRDDKSDFINAFGGESSMSNSIGSDNYSDEDDIESDILYLEAKKRILRKAKIHQEKEKAYIALNAHNIVNGGEPSSRRSGSSSIWSEAKEMIEAFKLDAVGGEEEGESMPSSSNDVETRANTSSHSSSDLCVSSSRRSSSPPHPHRKKAIRTRKRRKIDISMVKLLSSADFEKERTGDEVEVTITEDGGTHQLFVCPTTRCQEASEMHLSMDSRKWISQAMLMQIFALTNAAISEHRRSIIGVGKRE